MRLPVVNCTQRHGLVVVAAVFAIGSPPTTQSAWASGLELPAPGTTRSGVARIDAAAVHYNPAGIGLLARPSLLGSGGLLVANVAYTRERIGRYQFADSFDFALPIDEADIDPSLTGRAATVSDNPVSAIGDLFYAHPLAGLPLSLGLGVYVPYGAVLDLPDDGAQRWAVQDVTILAAALTPAVAFSPDERVSIGVSMPVYAGFAELSRVQDFAEISDVGDALERPPINQPNDFGPDAPTGVRELDVMGRQTVLSRATGIAPTFATGLSVRPTDRLTIGASYTHRAAMTFSGDIQIDMDDDFFTQDLADQGLQFVPLVEGNGTLSFVLPWSARLGVVAQVAPRHELMFSAALVGWSTVERFDVRAQSPDLAQPELGLPSTVSLAVERNWRNTWDAEAVHTWQVRPEIDFWYGLGLHSPAPPDSHMDLAAIDGWRATGVSGGAYALSAEIRLLFDAELQTVLSREVRSSRNDIGNGTYSLTILRLAAHIEMTF